MELMTFGAALKFAIALESQAIEVYENAGQSARDTGPKEMFQTFSAISRKRKTMLENLYNENVYSDQDTGIFEPIPSLNGAVYLTQTELDEQISFFQISDLVIQMEERIKRFYLDLAVRVRSQRRGLSKMFEKMAQENNDHRSRMESLFHIE